MKGLAEGLRTCVFLTTGAVLEAELVLPAVDGDEVLLLEGDDLSIGEEVLFVAGDTEASAFVIDVCCCCC